MERTVCVIILAILMASVFASSNIKEARAGTVTVPDDYATIQEAINNANPGDTIFVQDGTYEESLTINKDSLTLVGKNRGAFVNGTVSISADNVTVKGLTIIWDTVFNYGMGVPTDYLTYPVITLENCNYTMIMDNTIGGYGVFIEWAPGWGDFEIGGVGCLISEGEGNELRGNDIGRVRGCALSLVLYEGENDLIVGNDLYGGFYAYAAEFFICNDTSVYHNNFYGMHGCVASWVYNSSWDNGYSSGGNYWSDYTGVDANGDGVGDTPYVIDADNQDRYPFMNPWKPLLGDMNEDNAVNILDIVAIASIYGGKQGEPTWNPSVDIAAPYGVIDICDLVTCAAHYGEKYP